MDLKFLAIPIIKNVALASVLFLRRGARKFKNKSTGFIVEKVEENKYMQDTAGLHVTRGADQTYVRLDPRNFFEIDLKDGVGFSRTNCGFC
jgi:hypothetical protein